MTGFNSQSQITVDWVSKGFDKVLEDIKKIKEEAKGLNISGATKKGADGMLRNIKDIDIAQQKLAQNAERLELARLNRVDKLNKDEYNRNKDRKRELSRQYKENERNKKRELDGAKKLEDEKTKILNDAKTKQAFLRKQNATNERKEKLARDLKAIQEDRTLTKHQRNIEIAERKKAFAEYEKFVSSSRLKGAINGERIHIGRHGANSIEGINATNRRIEAENALSNKNSLLAKAGGNVSKARIASDEFNRKQSNRLEDARRLNSISQAELKIGTKRISEHEKDIQNAKEAVRLDKVLLNQKEKEIAAEIRRLRAEKDGSAKYLSIQSKITDGMIESNKIQTRINYGQLQYHDAKEAKRVHQINRDAQFYTRANVAFTAPAMIGAYNMLSDYKDAESVRIMLTAMYGKEKSGAEYDRLLERQLGSSLSLQKLASVSMAALTHKRNEADQGRVVDEKKLESALEKVITIGTINTVDEGRALKQILDIASKGEALPSKDIIPFLNAALGIDFQATYKEMYGKAFKMTTMSSDIFFKVLTKATESQKFNEAWDTFIKSFKQASERLNETTTNLSAAFGGLLDETLNLKGKMDGASTAFEKIRNWANKRDENGNPLTSQKVVIGAIAAVAGTLLMGLLISHKRKAMEFFFKGDVGKFGDFKKSFSDSRGVGRGFIGSSKEAFRESGLGSGAALKGFSTVGVIQGTYDLVVAKTLADWAIGSAEITAGLTSLFGPVGLAAGLFISLGSGIRQLLDEMSNDKNSWVMKLADWIGKRDYENERSGRVDANGRYVADPSKWVETGVSSKYKNLTIEQTASIYKAKAIEEAKAAALISASKNSGVNYTPVPIVNIMNSVNNTATSGISVKSDIETKQMGGQSYPSL